jgi:hypothetical protein
METTRTTRKRASEREEQGEGLGQIANGVELFFVFDLYWAYQILKDPIL